MKNHSPQLELRRVMESESDHSPQIWKTAICSAEREMVALDQFSRSLRSNSVFWFWTSLNFISSPIVLIYSCNRSKCEVRVIIIVLPCITDAYPSGSYPCVCLQTLVYLALLIIFLAAQFFQTDRHREATLRELRIFWRDALNRIGRDHKVDVLKAWQ